VWNCSDADGLHVIAVNHDDPPELRSASACGDDLYEVSAVAVSHNANPPELRSGSVCGDDADDLRVIAVNQDDPPELRSAAISSVLTLSEVLSYDILPHLPAQSPACALLRQIITGIQSPNVVSHEGSVQRGMSSMHSI